MTRFRFRPPVVEVDANLGWVLARGFGPVDAELGQPPSVTAAVACARQLDLAARIGSRTPVETLQRELGAEAAREMLVASAVVGALSSRLLALAREIAEGTPMVFLKGMALLAQGIVPANGRSLCDVDVLVRDGDAPAFIDGLRRMGFASEDFPATEHHFPPLTRGTSEMIEVHGCVLGVRATPEGPWVGLDELMALGHLRPLAGWPATAFVPSAAFLRAHALVHGLAQHGLAPDKYPMSRMFCDLIDLGPDADLGLVIDARADEVEAALGLCQKLRAAEKIDEGHQRALLHHLVLGSGSWSYVAALRLRGLGSSLTDHSPARFWWRTITQAAFPTKGQLDVLYGPRSSRLGYALLRLWRPFDLALRLVRYSILGSRL